MYCIYHNLSAKLVSLKIHLLSYRTLKYINIIPFHVFFYTFNNNDNLGLMFISISYHLHLLMYAHYSAPVDAKRAPGNLTVHELGMLTPWSCLITSCIKSIKSINTCTRICKQVLMPSQY